MTRARDDAGIVAALADISDAHIDGAWARGEGALATAEAALFAAIDAWAGRERAGVSRSARLRAFVERWREAHPAASVELPDNRPWPQRVFDGDPMPETIGMQALGFPGGYEDEIGVDLAALCREEERAAHPLVTAIALDEITDERRAEVLASLRELGARGGAIVPTPPWPVAESADPVTQSAVQAVVDDVRAGRFPR